MLYHIEQCSSMVEECLKKLKIDQKTPASLYEPIDYVLSSGGKRIRPALLLMSCNLFSDSIERAMMPAVAFEVFHNFTLVHDDVMDHADVRRNRPTVHCRWSESTAILSGDAMCILAYQYMSQSDPVLCPKLLDIFTRTALGVCEGQQDDMDFEQRSDVSIDEYIGMIRKKTAVLLAACLKAGALCGGSSDKDAEKLYQYGISLGLAFQIQDDWLDVYSDPKVFGKATGGDILSAKKTFLLLTALERADQEMKNRLLALLQNKNMPDEEKIRQVKGLYEQLSVGLQAEEAIAAYYQQAELHLQDIQLADPARKNELKRFTEQLLVRKK